MKQAYIYVRVSSDEQAEEGTTSLGFQVKTCSQYAERNGFEVAGVYQDDYTGRVRERPALMQMERDIAHKHVTVIIAYSYSRLTRHLQSGFAMLMDWGNRNYEVHVVEDGKKIDFNDSWGIIMALLKVQQADVDHSHIREQLMGGRNRQVDEGRIMCTGTPTYGYRVVDKGINRAAHYVIDEPKAQVVRQIFQWYTAGDEPGGPLSLKEIKRRLEGKNGDDDPRILPPQHYRSAKPLQEPPELPEWGPSTIRAILMNELYAGVFVWGKTRKVRENKLQAESKLVKMPTDVWIRVDVPELALVDRATFEAAARNLKSNNEYSRRHAKRDYLLSSHLHCGGCLKRMHGKVLGYSRSKQRRVYICVEQIVKTSNCQQRFKTPDAARCESIVWDWLAWLLSDEQHLIDGIESMGDRQENEITDKRQEMTRLQKSAGDLERRINGLIEDLSYFRERGSNQDTIDSFRRQIEDLSTAREALLAESQKIDGELAEQSLSQDNIERVFDYVREVRERLPQATYDDKRYLLRLFDVQAHYINNDNENRLDVSCAIPAWNQSIDLCPTS